MRAVAWLYAVIIVQVELVGEVYDAQGFSVCVIPVDCVPPLRTHPCHLQRVVVGPPVIGG